MAYVAAKGGEEAIKQAEQLFRVLNGTVTREQIHEIEAKLPYLIDRVMGEGSLYAPELAALAIAQTGGDLYEAVLLLRAYRSTQPRITYATPVRPDQTITVRRISAAFKDIPGGQILGPTLDYSHRVLRTEVLDQAVPPAEPEFTLADHPASATYPSVADWQRSERLMAAIPPHEDARDLADIPDVTNDSVLFPAPREHRLQALARADTGGVLALGYASMRGYGLIHPTVNELRLGFAEVQVTHPITGVPFSVGQVRVSQAEVVTTSGDKDSGLSIGFAATLGWNEVKLIAAATLDMEMNQPAPPTHFTEEFVMYHTEPIESSGFCIHFKLPHYVTFASSLDNLRKVAATFYADDSDDSVDQPVDESEAIEPELMSIGEPSGDK